MQEHHKCKTDQTFSWDWHAKERTKSRLQIMSHEFTVSKMFGRCCTHFGLWVEISGFIDQALFDLTVEPQDMLFDLVVEPQEALFDLAVEPHCALFDLAVEPLKITHWQLLGGTLDGPHKHPKFFIQGGQKHPLNIECLIHDFQAMCQKSKPTSQKVFVGMGKNNVVAGLVRCCLSKSFPSTCSEPNC